MYIFCINIYPCIWGDLDNVIDEGGMVMGLPTDSPLVSLLHVMQGVWGWGKELYLVLIFRLGCKSS